jgi:hypothetical protein
MLPEVSYVLQYDYGELDQVEYQVHWPYCPETQFRGTHASRRLLPSDRTNFGLPRICIVNYICWKVSFLGRYANDLSTFALLNPSQTEASARAWIDAFFFRASAMLPPNKRMVLNMEHAVPSTTISPSSLSTLSGFVDYTAVVASQRTAGKYASMYLTRLAHCFL